MQKFYYNWMKIAHFAPFTASLALVVATIPVPSPAFPAQQSLTKPLKTASLDSHDGLTIAADPASDAIRPPTETPIRNLFLAGDWIQTGLPATIESAVIAACKQLQIYLDVAQSFDGREILIDFNKNDAAAAPAQAAE